MCVSSTKKYGLPYQGSKRRIADKIIELLPPAPCLVDVFAGGCAITHAALESGKFGRVIANDLSDAPELFYHVAKSGGIKPTWDWMPSDFRCAAEFTVRALAGASTNAQTRVEKIFTI